MFINVQTYGRNARAACLPFVYIGVLIDREQTSRKGGGHFIWWCGGDCGIYQHCRWLASLIPEITNRWSMISIGNRWVIEAQTFCCLSITHRWHRLLIGVIDYSSMTHRLLIDYYSAHERHFSCTIFFVCDSCIFVRRICPCIWSSCWRWYWRTFWSFISMQPGNVCLHSSCFNFVFLCQIRLQPRDDIDE